jgi:nicotinate dehydrogenase subunit B
MTSLAPLPLSRRDLLRGAGALIVAINLPPVAEALAQPVSTMGKPPLTPDQLDSWIAVRQDGSVLAFFGKMDMGQGVDVAIGQIVAEELDVDVKRVSVLMGDTATSVNQGGASGSTGVQRGGIPLRNAAAEARRILVDMASAKLGTPADKLTVADGIVSDGSKNISYGELIGGRYFNAALKWNGQIGNNLVATGEAKPKSPSEYKLVGTSVPRNEVAAKVFGKLDYVTDVKVPGMVHGRMIRPQIAGAVPQSVDESSIKDIPGARVVWNKGFLGVVADTEWGAIKAAERLKVDWSQAKPPFLSQEALYDHIRQAAVVKRQVEVETGAVDSVFPGTKRIVTAEYEWPFQSHASMGPACAIADVRDGEAVVWTGSQKPHYTRDGVAKILGLPQDKVRGIWLPGPGSYGRNDAGDTAIDAALLSKAVGKPVRVQGMRYEGHGWDPKGPASVHQARAALDDQGKIIAYEFTSKGFSRVDIDTNEADPRHSLAGHLTGLPLDPQQGFGVPGESYGFANKRLAWETIAPLLDRASPLRTAHLRDPVGPQIHFASESFIDELAVAAGMDPVAFRLANLTDARDIAVVKAAAERAGWQPRPAGPSGSSIGKSDVATGRGIAFVQRSGTVVAVIAEIEIDRRSGRVWPRKWVVAHDCGIIINPAGLRQCVEGNIVQGTSRALWEEVQFNADGVTSIDWMSYPILDITEAPESIDVVLINRPEMPPQGAGEASTRPVAAAIANAIFDATGVRLRRAPFTPERVKSALTGKA